VNITLQQLEFFRTVARKLSFSNAAKDLYTSQPYVSNQIRRLEDHYGVPLFVRSQPRIALTEAGQALYERVEQILDDLEGLESVAQHFQGLHRGTVSLAATASPGNYVVPELIAAFHREFPDIVTRVRVGNTEDVQEWLDLDEAEVAVTPQQPKNGQMTCEPFYREPLVAICPAEMDIADTLSLEEFAALPKVIREDGSLTLSKMNDLLENYPGATEFTSQFGGTTGVVEAVAAGLGVSLVPDRSTEPWIQAGSIRKLDLQGVAAHLSFYLVYPRQRHITPAARTLIEHFRRNARP
jgi:DNA-binding transcriptional LysR family regulator